MSTTDATHLQAFADYQRGRGLATTTIRNRASILRTLTRELGTLHDATIFDLRRHLGRESTVTAATRRTERGAIIAYYTFLHDEGEIDTNPTTRLQPIHVPKGEPRPFTQDQIDQMLTRAYRKTRAMILLGYYQGFRVASIARVHGGDIDRDANTIRTLGKGRKTRTLPLHPVVADLATTMPADAYWFPARGARDGHIHGSSVTNLITLAKKRAGITDPTLTPHSLRHAFGTDLVEAGVDIRVVQVLMMHESLATTQIYTGVSDRLRRAGINALAPRDIPTKTTRTLRIVNDNDSPRAAVGTPATTPRQRAA